VDVEVIMHRLDKVIRWEYSFLCLLVFITLVLHFSVINHPDVLMFDEQHYVADARSVLSDNETARLEHPPLSKLMIMGGISLFGDNQIGWRFFSVLFGVIIVILFFFICRALSMSVRESNLATFLIAFENLTFVQASIAMLEVFFVAFMMLAFLLYLKSKYLLSGAAVALSALSKLTGVFALPVIGLHWLLVRRDHPYRVIVMLWLCAGLFVLLFWLLNYPLFHRFINPIEGMETMVNQLGSVTFTSSDHPSKSHPWEWIILPLTMPYWYTPHYFGAVNYNIWALIIPSMTVISWMAWKNIRRNVAIFCLAWFAGTYLILIPLGLISNRVMYVYYMYPTVGALCIPIALGLSYIWELWKSDNGRSGKIAPWVIGSYLFLHLLIFAVLNPLTS